MGCCIFIGVLEFGSDFLLCIFRSSGVWVCCIFIGVLAFGLLVFGAVFVWVGNENLGDWVSFCFLSFVCHGPLVTTLCGTMKGLLFCDLLLLAV